jgi:hypothetical protein
LGELVRDSGCAADFGQSTGLDGGGVGAEDDLGIQNLEQCGEITGAGGGQERLVRMQVVRLPATSRFRWELIVTNLAEGAALPVSFSADDSRVSFAEVPGHNRMLSSRCPVTDSMRRAVSPLAANPVVPTTRAQPP